jgi:hypothetical protein
MTVNEVLLVRKDTGYQTAISKILKGLSVVQDTTDATDAYKKIGNEKFGTIVIFDEVNITPPVQQYLRRMEGGLRHQIKQTATSQLAHTAFRKESPNTQTPIVILGQSPHETKHLYCSQSFNYFPLNENTSLATINGTVRASLRQHKEDFKATLKQAKAIRHQISLFLTSYSGRDYQNTDPSAAFDLTSGQTQELSTLLCQELGIPAIPANVGMQHSLQSLVELAMNTSNFRTPSLGPLSEFDLPPGFYDK